MSTSSFSTLLVAAVSARTEQALADLAQHVAAHPDSVTEEISTVTRVAGQGVDRALYELLAECGRHSSLRDFFTKSEIFALATAFLHKIRTSSWDTVNQEDRACLLHLLRALGNLSFDHPGNRAAMVAAGTVDAMMAAIMSLRASLPSADNERLRVVCAGAILNVGADTEEIQTTMLQSPVIELLVELYRTAPSHAHPQGRMAFNALNGFTDVGDATSRMAQARLPTALLHQLNVRLPGAHRLPPAADDEEADEEDEEEGGEVPEWVEHGKEILQLIRETVNVSDEMTAAFAHDDCLDLLLHFATKTNLDWVSSAASLIISITVSNDACLTTLQQKVAARKEAPTTGAEAASASTTSSASASAALEVSGAFLDLTHSWLQSDNVDLRTAGAICIGNIARNEPAAIALVSLPWLLSALYAMIGGKESSNIHAAFGTLRNLAIAQANKPVLIASGLAPQLMVGLHSAHTPIQYLCCSIARSLCIGQSSQVVCKLAAETKELLPRLAHFGGSEEFAVRSESTRALVNFIRYSESNAEIVKILADADVIQSFVFCLTCDKQPLLQSEGLIALLHMVTVNTEYLRIMFKENVLPPIAQILSSTATVLEVKCNALSLTSALFKLEEAAASEHSGAIRDAARALAAIHHEHGPLQLLVDAILKTEK
eukprot:m.647592 g.647592  ORF g.647592 m.647592 type:complete len:659 (-) comp58374_c0_seq1:133-2109(-)